MSIDFAAYPVLYVDDEAPNRVALRHTLGGRINLLTAASGDEALQILRERDVAVLVADQRMPRMTGVELCERAAELQPDALRIVVTGYADLDDAIDAINRGKVTRYLRKPYRSTELQEVLHTAITLVHVHRTTQQMGAQLLRGGANLGARMAARKLVHEINNHSTILHLNVQIIADALAALKRDRHDPERVDRAIHAAEASLRDCTVSLEQLRLVSQGAPVGEPPAGEVLPPCDAAQVVESTVRLMRSSLGRAVQVHLVIDGSPHVAMEASALGQMLINLMMNASQAIGGAGVTEGVIDVRVSGHGDVAVVSVSDNGPGVPDELLGRVFDPFFTTRPEGDGVGLAVVRDLVVRAGGSIRYRRREGSGGTFIVELPAVGGPALSPP